MSPAELNLFLWGALATAGLVVSLFFFRFWRVTSERLFLFFALGFLTLAANWVGLALIHPPVESRHYLYTLRLLAFVLIIVGIVDKNRRSA
ncbi:MAG TPA: DUF5985 family protein [Steroidobacteraceae bacterium]|nr:DUF5985 family protein [Steroidobacteraceae bacterium]